MIVAKFGGSSLADAAQFQKVRDIVFADSRRRIVVPSAPGKRFRQDDKVTDLLYRCHHAQQNGEQFQPIFAKICERYLEIAEILQLSIDLNPYLDDIRQRIAAGASAEYCASRGEYLNGLLLADYLGFYFLDAAEVILFDHHGVLDAEKTNIALCKRLEMGSSVVLPGFYGSNAEGKICVFSRGGSDITGALAARAVQAELYENWTDVSGFLMADPKIVCSPRTIQHITYQEMHELSCAGATVLHEESVFPVSCAGIPIQIRNTNQPESAGTTITATAVHRESFSIFAGIAGKKGFSLLIIEKEAGTQFQVFIQRVFQAAKNHGLSFQYLQSNASSICFIVNTQQYEMAQSAFWREISQINVPYSQIVQQGFACIVLVGYGIIHNSKTINRVYEALNRKRIPVAMINQGISEISTWISVQESKMEEAIQILYEEFSN